MKHFFSSWGGGRGEAEGLMPAENSKHSSLSRAAGGGFLTGALYNTTEEMLPEEERASITSCFKHKESQSAV